MKKKYKLFRGIFFLTKRNLYFYIEHFVEILLNLPVFSVVRLQIHFGSGAAQIRNDFFQTRILLKVSDSSGSGSTTTLPEGQFAVR
jgi:hypothetical protein